MKDDAPESQKQRLYRLAFEDARDPTIVFDADGRVLLLNRAARELPESLVEGLVDGAPPRAADLARFREDLLQRGRAHVEIHAEGARILALDGKTHGDQHIVSIRDVTEQRRVDSELRTLQRAESIGHLTASVVHDFNNLLTPITCLSSQLERELDGAGRPASMARDIRSAAERAAGLARQVLSFARRYPTRVERVNVSAAVEELRVLLERVVGAGVEVELALDAMAGDAALDRERLEHVLLNLAASARDSMPAGGRLTIRTGSVSFDGETTAPDGASTGAFVVLAVSDTGGLGPAQARERVFESFLSATATTREAGAGLSSARRFVAESRGCMTRHGEPGRGTTLALYLPRLERDGDTSVSRVSASPRVSGGETILVVDDMDGVRSAVRAVLEDRGYHVLVAASPEEGLEVAQTFEGTIHLAIIDVIMPRMPGTDLAQRIQLMRPTRVLLTSGQTDRVLEHHGVSADHALLRKAFSPAELLRKVREVLDADGACFERSCG